MILTDINVLIYAHREESPGHAEYRNWLEEAVSGPEPFGISELVLSGCLRLLTHPSIFDPPSPLETAMAFVSSLHNSPTSVVIGPGRRHWALFLELCRKAGARGNLVPDAYLAALAIESGSEWITTDRDYSRFPELRWRHPLD